MITYIYVDFCLLFVLGLCVCVCVRLLLTDVNLLLTLGLDATDRPTGGLAVLDDGGNGDGGCGIHSECIVPGWHQLCY